MRYGYPKKMRKEEYHFYSENAKSVGIDYRWNVENALCIVQKLKVFVQPMLNELYATRDEM